MRYVAACARLLAAGALIGCGQAGDATGADSVEPAFDAASAQARGTVNELVFEPGTALSGEVPGYIFVHNVIESRHREIMLADFPATCGDERTLGMILYLDLFEDASLPDSSVTRPGTFEIWAPALRGGPIPTDARAVAELVVSHDDGGFVDIAVAGSVRVTRVSRRGIAGDFALSFETGSLEGSFVAPHCETWHWGASIPRHSPGGAGF
jgi:hypothetical protein